jgi:hypothetical protein
MDITLCWNLGVYVASSHFTILGTNYDPINCGLGSLYNSWALDFGPNIYICNNRNHFNYIITYLATALDVIDFGK